MTTETTDAPARRPAKARVSPGSGPPYPVGTVVWGTNADGLGSFRGVVREILGPLGLTMRISGGLVIPASLIRGHRPASRELQRVMRRLADLDAKFHRELQKIAESE